MKRHFMHTIACTAALAVIATTSGSAAAQRLGRGERIVESHVVSDTVVGGSGSTESGSCPSGDCGSGSYVGDLGRDGLGLGGYDVGDYGDGIGCLERKYGQPDLFYNNYTQGNCNRTNAQMYLSPVPVPPNVGHTFFTYQPFYPEELLYSHKNRFHNYYDNGRGMNRTRATYWSPPVRQAASNFYWNYLRIPR
ncbi:hypothetical protein [Novipirellula artificiosorum]|uniref:Uncharacterized protein n=1 Tax=Novipirellula artificiosorum TaxID=2528016 RepID=A0A5C6DM31_9BACT|nr:hypothetical protein [Novipirellula artificiosorum]TWU35919.1 hypothetical protein Poly41_36710 [Novipirellula artificiosorum]